jgi:hypothetical protein
MRVDGMAYRGSRIACTPTAPTTTSAKYTDATQAVRQTTLINVAFATKCSRGFGAFFRLFASVPGYTKDVQNPESF